MRLLIHPSPKSIAEAARFLAASLLISHGIRRDAVAAVRVGGRWIIAPGSRVRHLRPDADTAEGWVRAVLRGARLGGIVARAPPGPVGTVYEIVPGDPRGLKMLGGEPVTICLPPCPYEGKIVVEAPDWPSWSIVEVANIIVDRRGAGLDPC